MIGHLARPSPFLAPRVFLMLDGLLIFVDVDTQRDFLEPGASLFVGGSEAIRPNLARLTTFARANRIPIIATACAHEAADREDGFPPHCIRGTPGQERVEETADPGTMVIEPGSGAVPQFPALHMTIHKRAYDVFSTPEAEQVFAVFAPHEPTFVVYGVATDYCVRCAVDGLIDRGYPVAVVTDAVRGVDPERAEAELARFASRGALLTTTDAVCANNPS